MKSRLYGMMGLASLAAVGVVISSQAHAQTATFGTGAGTYALLNGTNLTVYLDNKGDIAAPNVGGGNPKPGGDLNGLNQPKINPDGSIVEPPPAANGPQRTYGLLYNTI